MSNDEIRRIAAAIARGDAIDDRAAEALSTYLQRRNAQRSSAEIAHTTEKYGRHMWRIDTGIGDWTVRTIYRRPSHRVGPEGFTTSIRVGEASLGVFITEAHDDDLTDALDRHERATQQITERWLDVTALAARLRADRRGPAAQHRARCEFAEIVAF